jgi:hypothetical protein
VNRLGVIGSKEVCGTASKSNLNEFYSNSKLNHTSIEKHNVGSMNVIINYIKPKTNYQFRK